jgi:hypothetical protein
MEKISTSKNWKARLEDIAIQVYGSKGHDVVELSDGVVRHLEDDCFCFLPNLRKGHSVKAVLYQTSKGNYILVIAYDAHADAVHKALFDEFKKEHNIPAMVKSMVK